MARDEPRATLGRRPPQAGSKGSRLSLTSIERVCRRGTSRVPTRRRAARCLVGLTVLVSVVLPQLTAVQPASADGVATLVRTVPLSSLSPPSPDPAGIAYLPSVGQLLGSDSEVEEMSIYQQVNLYQLTLQGTLGPTGKTTAWSNEPAGLSFA